MNSLRSTPLRLTGMLIVIFALFALAGYGAAFLITRAALEHDVAERLRQTVEAVASTQEQDEIAERAGEVAATADTREILLRFAVPGAAAIGNLPATVSVASGAVVDEAALPLPEDDKADSYLAWRETVGGGDLTILVGRDSLVGLGETFAHVLVFSLLPALLLATAVGALVARSARDRVEAIRVALARLTSGDNGARVATSGEVRDDLGQIAQAVNRMAQAQEASIESLRQVSADIAHDLRTPIQRVAVFLEKLEDMQLPEAAQDTIAAARRETGQIVATFGSLLQIAQMESGRARQHFTTVDLAALAADLGDVYGPAAEESGHVLTTTASGKALVQGDQTLLGRMVANLIENALRHAPPGQVGLQVTGGASTVLTVSDDGPGIPADERNNVLRRLYRLERSRTSEGSGLGLSLVAAIAELHGATLVLGDAGPGLVVTVTFPPRDSALPGATGDA